MVCSQMHFWMWIYILRFKHVFLSRSILLLYVYSVEKAFFDCSICDSRHYLRDCHCFSFSTNVETIWLNRIWIFSGEGKVLDKVLCIERQQIDVDDFENVSTEAQKRVRASEGNITYINTLCILEWEKHSSTYQKMLFLKRRNDFTSINEHKHD